MVDDALGVGRAGVRVDEVLARQMGQRDRAAVVALDGRKRTAEQGEPARRQPLVQHPMDALRLDARLDQLGRHHVRARRRVLEHELARVGDEPDVERVGDRRRDLGAELLGELVDDLGGARRRRLDEVDGAEAGVVVMVVDVQDVDLRATHEVDGHPVDVAAIEEHDDPLDQIRRRHRLHVPKVHSPILVRQRELVGGHEHDDALAELLEDQPHPEQRAERVAVRVLVRREQQLVRPPQLLDDLVALGQQAHRSSGAYWSRRLEIRIPRSTESS